MTPGALYKTAAQCVTGDIAGTFANAGEMMENLPATEREPFLLIVTELLRRKVNFAIDESVLIISKQWQLFGE